MKSLHKIAWILLIIGGLNWGLEAFGYNVVAMLGSSTAMVIYIIVALSALYELFTHKGKCKDCAPQSSSAPQM